jgi:integrase/recombinase XerD
MNGLGQALEDYMCLRRAAGYSPERLRGQLEDFVGYMGATGEAIVSVRSALAWATDPAKTTNCWSARLSAVRGFARYLKSFDDAHEVPPRGLLPPDAGRQVPYLYSPGEVAGLMGAARRLSPRLLGATMEALIGLLAATGLRPGEAYALERADVDFDAPALAVRAYKAGGSRLIPLHPSSAHALRAYGEERDQLLAGPGGPRFFVFRQGEGHSRFRAPAVFAHLLADAAVAAPPGRRRPRLYDLRHSFAVATLATWHGEGADVGPRLPVLSAYMGHKKPKETYWYLESAPELMALVARRLERSLGEAP